jgi:hypothetical protein
MDQVIPGGILSVKHTWPEKKAYYNQDAFLTITQEPSEVSYYFWAQQFWFENGDGGYLGIQTRGQLNERESKIGIFSIWKALDSKKSNIENSWAGSFGHEGTGFSCKIPFDWRSGIQYRLRLSKMSAYNNSDSSNWWSAFIQEECIGQIQIPDKWGGLGSGDNFFVEYFLPVQNCDKIPYAKATLHKPTRNIGEVLPIGLPEFEAYGVCASSGTASNQADASIILETGYQKLQA